MSATLQATADAFLARYEGLRARLPGAAEARQAAAEAFRRSGLPTLRNEAWHYTSLRPLADLPFAEPIGTVDGAAGLVAALPALDVPRIVMVNGRVREDLSRLDVPETLRLGRFAANPAFAHTEADAPLAALNTMLAEDGAVIEVTGQAGVLMLASLGTDVAGRAVAFHPRHRIRVAAGAELALLEVASGSGAYLHNPVIEVEVAEGGHLTHVRLQQESQTAFHLTTVFAEIAANATYDFFALNLGGRLARTEVHARLGGPEAIVHLNGAQVLGGVQHGDITTVVEHASPNCASRQTVKNVLDGHAKGVFQGRIEVDRVAQKTDGYQMNQALLLSPDAEIDSKPQLRIFADDVKCSHGATVGELDAGQLFYLRSRGIPEAKARSILIRAFLTEALDAVADTRLRAVLDDALTARWAEAA